MSEQPVGGVKKPVMQMPKSMKRMLALMGDDNRKKCQKVMWESVKTYNFQHLQMLRRKRSEKDESGE